MPTVDFAFRNPTPLMYGKIGLLLLFIIQLLLCFKAKKLWVKLIPVYLVIIAIIFCFAIYIGVFGSYSAGAISGNAIVALVFAFVIGIAAIGILPAWIIYLAVKLKKDKT